jgi:hypothetical protein
VVRPDSPKPGVSNAVYIIERNVRIKLPEQRIPKGRKEECRKRRIESDSRRGRCKRKLSPKIA